MERLTIAAQAAGFSMVALDDTELGELRNRETERGNPLSLATLTARPRRWTWPFAMRSNGKAAAVK
ncbi:MAG: hypothetical protein AAFZ01_10105 [Pseudomonadota bacterium]